MLGEGKGSQERWGNAEGTLLLSTALNTSVWRSSFLLCLPFMWHWGKVPIWTMRKQTKWYRTAMHFTSEEASREASYSRSQVAWIQFLILNTVINIHVLPQCGCDMTVRGHLQDRTVRATARKQSEKTGRKLVQTFRKNVTVSALRGSLQQYSNYLCFKNTLRHLPCKFEFEITSLLM